MDNHVKAIQEYISKLPSWITEEPTIREMILWGIIVGILVVKVFV